MKINLYRKPGLYGYFLNLSVFFDGKKLCEIGRNETKELTLPDIQGELVVKMEPSSSSKALEITPADHGALFSCGVRWWAVLDPIGLHLLSSKKFPVFYLRKEILS